MLTNPTVEKETGVIKLEGVSVEGLVVFVEFVYLGKLFTCCQLLCTRMLDILNAVMRF